LNESTRAVQDTREIIQENEELRARVAELEKENREYVAYRDKIEELSAALNLKSRFSDYTTIGGNVVTRNTGNWFDVLKIDVGTGDGVGPDMPVVTASMALVGKTLYADSGTSRVITLIDEECTVSGWVVGRNGGAAVVRGDILLRARGMCRMDLIPDELDVTPGDVVETSGIGGVFPRGIEIGVVESVRETANGLSRYAVIQPYADLIDIEEVFILKGYGSDIDAGAVDKTAPTTKATTAAATTAAAKTGGGAAK